jgi:hypothetical protein
LLPAGQIRRRWQPQQDSFLGGDEPGEDLQSQGLFVGTWRDTDGVKIGRSYRVGDGG